MSYVRARTMFGVVGMAMCAAVIGCLFFFEIAEANQRIIDVASGIILGWGTMIVGFYFGSSEGSKQKTAAMTAMAAGDDIGDAIDDA